MKKESAMALAVILIGAFAGSLFVNSLMPRKVTPPAPAPSPAVTANISPNGHVVTLTVTGWKWSAEVNKAIDAFLESRPELWCTSLTLNSEPLSSVPLSNGATATLMCTKTQPPTRNAQTRTGPP